MKKFNLSEIMKRAWNIVRKYGESLSEALKESWAIAKEATRRFSIDGWFIDKNIEKFTTQHLICYSTFGLEDIIKETEKAVHVDLNMRTKSGMDSIYSKKVWIPKSCIKAYEF